MSNVVAYKSPTLEAHRASMEKKRHAERVRQEQLDAAKIGKRNFTGASGSRLFGGLGSINTGINVDLAARLGALRAASRDLSQNTAIGRRFENSVKRNVIGSEGIRLQVRAKTTDGKPDGTANSAIEYHWTRWNERGLCEVSNRLSLREVCKLLIGCLVRDGEYLVRRVRSARFDYAYKLQILDVDRLDISHNVTPSPGRNAIRMGIEIDQLGTPVAYHLTHWHPGDPGGNPSPVRERVPANEIFHDFLNYRPEQVRGFPWSHAVLNRIAMLNGYEEAAVIAARIGASKMGFYTQGESGPAINPEDVSDGTDAMGNLSTDIEPGTLGILPPGVKFESFNPDYPTANFEPFVTAAMRDIAAGLDISAHSLSGNMKDVNYSSARIAELSERDVWRDIQKFFIESFMQPVYKEWLQLALIGGSITFPDTGRALPADKFQKFYAASGFQARGWQWVDPENEAKASVIQINNRLRSRRSIVEEQGGDLEDIHDDIVAETALMADLPPITPATTPAAAGPGATP